MLLDAGEAGIADAPPFQPNEYDHRRKTQAPALLARRLQDVQRRGEVIYVGKAISLKNRVRQYFQSSKNHPPKVVAMVRQIADFEYIRVSNEPRLFARVQPHQGVSAQIQHPAKGRQAFSVHPRDLKQDFPRLDVVRRVKNDGAKYLGPFLSGLLLRDGLSLVRDHYPIRQCKKDIGRMIARRERPCLMYTHRQVLRAVLRRRHAREEYHAPARRSAFVPFRQNGRHRPLAGKADGRSVRADGLRARGGPARPGSAPSKASTKSRPSSRPPTPCWTCSPSAGSKAPRSCSRCSSATEK
jgi:hypothetical protein